MAVGQRVRGITIEFEGDTTKLGAALRKIQAETKKVDAALRQVDRTLKFNPGNTELLAQKQQLLKQKIESTEQSLKALKQTQAKLDDDPAVDKTSAEYMQLRREIIKTESQLKNLQKEQRLVAASLSRMGQASASLSKLGKSLTAAGEKMRGLSNAAGVLLVAMSALAVKAGQYADNLNTMAKQTGISTRQLQLYQGAAELVDVSVSDLASSNARLVRSMNQAKKGTGNAADAFKTLGVEITDSSGKLRNGQEVFFEVLKALGEIENTTERDALAMQIFGRSAQKLNPLILGGAETLEQFTKRADELGVVLDQKTIDAANAFNDTIDESKSLIQMAGMQLGATIGQVLMPIIQKLTDGLVRLAVWFGKLPPAALGVITAIAGIVFAAGRLLLVLGPMATGLSNILKLLSLINAGAAAGGAAGAFTKLFAVIKANPIILLVGALVALTAWIAKSGISAEELQAKIEGFGAKIAEVIPKIVDALPTAITAFVEAFTTMITAVVKALPTLLPAVIQAGITLFMGLVDALPAVIDALVAALPAIIDAIVAAIPVLIPAVINAGIALFMGIVDAIPKIAVALKKALPKIVKAVKAGLAKTLPKVWDEIKDTAIGRFVLMVKGIGDKIKAVYDKIVEPFRKAKEKIDEVVKAIKDFFPIQIGNFAKIKLPHLKITSKGTPPWGIGGKGSLPKWDINWYKRGGIFDSPSVIGVGEAGREAVIPLDELWRRMDRMTGAMQTAGGPPINFYITVQGNDNPEAFADRVVHALKQKVRVK